MLDLRRLQLTVFCDYERAISLYQRLGFEIEGRHECYAAVAMNSQPHHDVKDHEGDRGLACRNAREWEGRFGR